MNRWRRRIRYLLDRDAEERDVAEEMQNHIELEAEALTTGGLDPREARRLARLRFGGTDRYREQTRESRGIGWIDDLAKDLHFAARTLRRSPGFTWAALLVLAVGIGATTTIFGIVRGVLLDPLPYPESQQLVRVWGAAPELGARHRSVSVPDFRDWRDRSSTLAEMTAYTTLISHAVMTADGPAEEVRSIYVSGDFFRTFGVTPALGTAPTLEDERTDPYVVTLSHAYWMRRFGGDPTLVGRSITLEGRAFKVAAVMPKGFSAPEPGIEAWLFLETIPQTSAPHWERFVNIMQVVGRLEPGASLAQARADLTAVATALAIEYPETNEDVTAVTLVPFKQSLVGDVAGALWVVLGAVGFLLAIACTNVAGLLVARAGERRSEVAVRQSLGAGQARVVRQLLAEAGLLSAFGGILGFVLAWVTTSVFARMATELIPRAGEVTLDFGMFAFALVLVGVTTFASGLAPAKRAAAIDLGAELRAGGRSAKGGVATERLRRTVVGAQVAVATVLLVGATLMSRSLDALRSVDAGFEPSGAVAMTLTLNQDIYTTSEEYIPFYYQILDRIGEIPSVTHVGSMRRIPTRGGGESWGLSIPGVWEPGPSDDPSIEVIHVGGDIFPALGTRVLRGRAFTRSDDASAEPVILVNAEFERRYLNGGNALGVQAEIAGAPVEIIGVVEDLRHESIGTPPYPAVYINIDQNPRIGVGVVARTEGDPVALLAEMRSRVIALEKDQPVTDLTLLQDVVAGSVSRDRLLTLLFIAFAALATSLSALGVYGVIAYTVRQRYRDVGLRMALGARTGNVVGLVVRQGMKPVAVGLAAGLIMASLVSGSMQTLLFGVHPLDGTSYAVACTVLAVSALSACLLPAVHAARLRPMRVLRNE